MYGYFTLIHYFGDNDTVAIVFGLMLPTSVYTGFSPSRVLVMTMVLEGERRPPHFDQEKKRRCSLQAVSERLSLFLSHRKHRTIKRGGLDELDGMLPRLYTHILTHITSTKKS